MTIPCLHVLLLLPRVILLMGSPLALVRLGILLLLPRGVGMLPCMALMWSGIARCIRRRVFVMLLPIPIVLLLCVITSRLVMVPWILLVVVSWPAVLLLLLLIHRVTRTIRIAMHSSRIVLLSGVLLHAVRSHRVIRSVPFASSRLMAHVEWSSELGLTSGVALVVRLISM